MVSLKDQMKVVAKNGISATPAIADGVIYLRTHDTMWALGGQRR